LVFDFEGLLKLKGRACISGDIDGFKLIGKEANCNIKGDPGDKMMPITNETYAHLLAHPSISITILFKTVSYTYQNQNLNNAPQMLI